MTDSPLEMRYDPKVINLLGIQLYHQFPAVLNELLTNSYDAKASEVEIVLDKQNKKFTISDNGDGMSFDDLRDKYLVIGRNRRNDKDNSTSPERAVTGKKGVGKLAPFGIANIITVITTKDKVTNGYKLELSEIMKSSIDNPYRPKKLEVSTRSSHGTEITISEISLNNFSKRDLTEDAQSLSRRFHKFGSDFKVTLSDGTNKILLTNDLYFDSLNKQFKWSIPKLLSELSRDGDLLPLQNKFGVEGLIFTTSTPIKDTTARGIFIFSRGKLASEAGFFEARDNEQFNTYATGYLNIDWIDKDADTDAINTARQNINWELNDDFKELRNLLQKMVTRINRSWRDKRKEAKLAQLKKIIASNVNKTSYQERIDKDKSEKTRFDAINDKLAEVLRSTDDDNLQKEMVDVTMETSKPARQDASPYKRLVPQPLAYLDKTKGNSKIQKILAEVNEPIMADSPEEFINCESLLLRCLIDSGTSAYLDAHFDLLQKYIKNDLPEAKGWYKYHKCDITQEKIQNRFSFADKYKTTVQLLKLDGKITKEEENSFFQAIDSLNSHQNNVVKNLNLAMHSPIGMINYSELKQHWQGLSSALQKIIENI